MDSVGQNNINILPTMRKLVTKLAIFFVTTSHPFFHKILPLTKITNNKRKWEISTPAKVTVK